MMDVAAQQDPTTLCIAMLRARQPSALGQSALALAATTRTRRARAHRYSYLY